MKTIRELRGTLRFNPQEINSFVKFFKNENIDWDVYLPTKGKNLQRDFVWTLNQKREIIWSILIKRNIPRMAIINTIDQVYQIIDGKQRLSSIFDFTDNKFTLMIEGEEYLFNHLPIDYQNIILGYAFPYYIVNEESNDPITDEDKINWFKFINFAGTPQDKEHLDSLQ
jgi:uncharacterized protein with ParB-like and HNH nuclease domain